VNLKDFFIRFAAKVGEVETSEGDNAPFYDYKTYRKTSADSRDSIERRFNIILTKYLEFNQSLIPRDPERNYEYWEKLVDHRVPHSKGGPTTLENGQWACISCNGRKLDKTQ
jgi:Ser-tRNA(Ala) deacylase AlaX